VWKAQSPYRNSTGAIAPRRSSRGPNSCRQRRQCDWKNVDREIAKAKAQNCGRLTKPGAVPDLEIRIRKCRPEAINSGLIKRRWVQSKAAESAAVRLHPFDKASLVGDPGRDRRKPRCKQAATLTQDILAVIEDGRSQGLVERRARDHEVHLRGRQSLSKLGIPDGQPSNAEPGCAVSLGDGSPGYDRFIERSSALRRKLIPICRVAVSFVDEQTCSRRFCAHQVQDRPYFGKACADTAGVLRAGDADELCTLIEERLERARCQLIAAVKGQTAFAQGHARADQRVARWREAR
jgi:hypothetical protein